MTPLTPDNRKKGSKIYKDLTRALQPPPHAPHAGFKQKIAGMCPDWSRSQLPSTEISFLGKLFKKLPTMDFSARTAKASGLGRETTEEEDGWKPLVGVPHFSLPRAELQLSEMPGEPTQKQRVG